MIIKEPKKPSRKDLLITELENRIQELESHDILRMMQAREEIKRLTQAKFMGSGVILHIKSLRGSDLVAPVMIQGGLSDETIAAIQADLLRSYEYRIEIPQSMVPVKTTVKGA